VTDALEIEEGEEALNSKDLIEDRIKSGKRRRYIMMGLATVGGFPMSIALCTLHFAIFIYWY
jgi:hypothetical protein